MTKKDIGTPQDNSRVFDSYNEIRIGNKTYQIERHFIGKRDFREAVFSTAINEAKRDKKADKNSA